MVATTFLSKNCGALRHAEAKLNTSGPWSVGNCGEISTIFEMPSGINSGLSAGMAENPVFDRPAYLPIMTVGLFFEI